MQTLGGYGYSREYPVERVYRDIRGVSSNLLAISDRLERGEGTLGKLLSSDDRVYRDVAARLA